MSEPPRPAIFAPSHHRESPAPPDGASGSSRSTVALDAKAVNPAALEPTVIWGVVRERPMSVACDVFESMLVATCVTFAVALAALPLIRPSTLNDGDAMVAEMFAPVSVNGSPGTVIELQLTAAPSLVAVFTSSATPETFAWAAAQARPVDCSETSATATSPVETCVVTPAWYWVP